MVNDSYVPSRGDIVHLTFGPVRGHEQRGRRPAVVLTSRKYNELVGLAFVCPITSKIKGYPFEVPVVVKGKPSVVLCDHLRSLAWRDRNISYVMALEIGLVREVITKVGLLLTS